MLLGNSMQRQFPTPRTRSAAGWPPPPRHWARARSVRSGSWSPSRTRVRGLRSGQRARTGRCQPVTGQAVNIVSVAPPVFSDDNRSALLSAVLAVDPEEMRARDTIDWLRATLPKLP